LADLTLGNASWIDGNLGLGGPGVTLRVNDRVDIGGMFYWSNSSRLSGAGVTYANGGAQISDFVYLDDHHLILDGNSTSTGTARVEFVGPSVFEIRPGSSYEHQGGFYFLNGGSNASFINDGTLIKSTNPGETRIYVPTNNSGLIHLQTGTLAFYNGSGSNSGDFLGDPGTTFEFAGGDHFLPDSSIVADNVTFASGHTVQGTYNVTTATRSSAWELTFTDTANVISYGSSFYVQLWTVNFNAMLGGPIQFDTLSVNSGASGAAAANFNSGDPIQVTNLELGRGGITTQGDVTVDGLFTWNASGHFSGPGTLHANGDVLVGPGGGEKTLRDCVFNNAGTATLLGPFTMASGTVVFNNLATGVVDIRADSGPSGSIISGLGQTLNNAGTMIKSAGTGNSTIAAPTTNTGTVEVQTGELWFYTYYSGYYTQTAGQTVLNGGDLLMYGPAPLSIIGGLLAGEGTISGNVIIYAAGMVTPGLSVGVLDVVGNYTQVTGSTLEIEIDGLGQGMEYDLLTVSGTASVAGGLDVVLSTDGFAPAPGDRFQILTAGTVTGQFDPVNVIHLSPYLTVDAVYTTTDVTLHIEGVVPGDCDLDGDADLDDFHDLEACLLGPGGGIGPACRCFDFDNSGNVDLGDFAAFQAAFTG
jgi:hypothetical protein